MIRSAFQRPVFNRRLAPHPMAFRVALALLLSLPALAWSLSVEEVGYWVGGTYEEIAPDGQLVYLAAGLRGIEVIDASDMAAPRPLAKLDLPGEARALAIANAHAYVAAGSAGLQVVAIGTPEVPTRVGQLALTGTAQRIAIDGNLAAVLAALDDTRGFLHLIDVSQPRAPRALSTIETVPTDDLALRDGIVYLAGADGLQIIDATHPAGPAWMGGFDSGNAAAGVALQGDYAYLVAGRDLVVADIARPNAPLEVGRLANAISSWSGPLRIAVSGDRVYASTAGGLRWGGGGISILDVSNPAAPRSVGYAESPTTGLNAMLTASGALAAQGRVFYAIQDVGLALYALGESATESPLPMTGLYKATAQSNALDLAVAHGSVFLANGIDGLRILAVEDPRAPVPIGSFSGYPSQVKEVSTDGEFASVFKLGPPNPYGYSEFYNCVLDVREASAPGPAVCRGFSWAYAALKGSLGFEIGPPDPENYDLRTALIINDLTDPAAIAELSRLDIGATIQAVTIAGSHAYLATDTGLTIVDFGNARAPRVVAAIALGAASRVAVDAGIAYVAGGNQLWVVDVAASQRPRLLGGMELAAPAMDLAGADGLAFVAQGEVGLEIIDARDPTQPRQAARHDSPASVNAVAADGDWLYLADGINGLSILRVWREPTVFRFYNTATGTHFYTSDAAERDFVLAAYPSFRYEGAAFAVADSASPAVAPVYRFYNSRAGTHFYTIDDAEREFILANYAEFVDEGIAYRALANPVAGATPLYRFYNAATGAHFFTPSTEEWTWVANNLPEFHDEGIAYYVYPLD